jgi:hypothetical protein
MSQIGFIKQEQMVVKREGKEEVVKWFECHFRVGGVRPFSAKMTKNAKKDKETHPDFHLYLRANVNKGDKFRDIRIGALWMKTKVFDGVEKTFMTGNVFMDFREVPITVWKAEPRFEGDTVEYLYDISMMKDTAPQRDAQKENGYETVYEDAKGEVLPAYDIPEDEIPF